MDEKRLAMAAAVILLISFAGCGRQDSDADEGYSPGGQDGSEEAGNLNGMKDSGKTEALEDNTVTVQTDSEIEELDKGLSAVRYEGEDGFGAFLDGGGAKTDGEVVQFLAGSFCGKPEWFYHENTELWMQHSFRAEYRGRLFLWQEF